MSVSHIIKSHYVKNVINIAKDNGGYRTIVIPTDECKNNQRDILKRLEDKITFSKSSYGFRRGIGTKNAVNAILQARNDGYQWISSLDIRECFQHINPEEPLSVIEPLCGKINDYDNIPFIAQGFPISPLLCNIKLDPFDRRMDELVSKSKGRDEEFRYIRYADNIYLCCKRKIDAECYTMKAVELIHGINLQIKPETIRHVNQGIEVLGFTITRRSIGPKPKAIENLKQSLYCLINQLGTDWNIATTSQITSLLRGWSEYYGIESLRQALRKWHQLRQCLAMMDIKIDSWS